MKVSDWQDKNTFPTIPGLYQVTDKENNSISEVIAFSYFDGTFWYTPDWYGGLHKLDKAEQKKQAMYQATPSHKITPFYIWRGVIDD